MLFEVKFNEPVLVIDLETNKGIIGRMSGVVDNFQLQLLLMLEKQLSNQEQTLVVELVLLMRIQLIEFVEN